MPIVVIHEVGKFSLEIPLVPEKSFVEVLAANRANESFDERMRHRDSGEGFDLRNVQNPEIGSPAMKCVQRVVIGAEVFRGRMTPNDAVEHPTQHGAVNSWPCLSV